jgi:hypothetical protein
MDRKSMFLGLLGAVILSGCGEGMGGPEPYLYLTEDTGEELDNVPAVPRLRLSGLPPIPLEDIWLIRGDVSSVSQGRLRRRDPPKTVQDHREPLASWTEGADIVLAPSQVLEPGQRYSLVALGAGLLGSFVVSEEARPLLYLWSSPAASPGGQLAYCAGVPPIARLEGLPFSHTDSTDEAAEAGVLPHVGTDACVRFTVRTEAGGFFMPPSIWGDFLVDPTPVAVFDENDDRETFVSVPAHCTEEAALHFTGGCAAVDGPALRISVAPGAYFLELKPRDEEADSERLLISTLSAATHNFGPLLPTTEYSLTVVRFSGEPLLEQDAASQEPIHFLSGFEAARFVLTEILADPLGSEPASEWVEVYNAGNAEGSLRDLLLWDSGGASVLPDVILKPGQFGLIIRHDFSVGVDTVPHFECVPVFVDSIGQNGLRNSGEEVRLETAEGELISKIPALAAGAGQSVARREPWSPDLESSFVRTRPPSPGSFGLESFE